MAEKLSSEEIKKRCEDLAGWTLNPAGQIERRFEFKNFKEALLFVNSIGWFAEKAQHHPDILVNWNKVTLSLTTHDAGGLTEKDFRLAEQANGLT